MPHYPEGPNSDADRQSRPWYDLAVLADHDIGKTAMPDRQLLEDIVKHKNIFFSCVLNYDACLSGVLRPIRGASLLKALRTDYEKMIRDGMLTASRRLSIG